MHEALHRPFNLQGESFAFYTSVQRETKSLTIVYTPLCRPSSPQQHTWPSVGPHEAVFRPVPTGCSSAGERSPAGKQPSNSRHGEGSFFVCRYPGVMMSVILLSDRRDISKSPTVCSPREAQPCWEGSQSLPAFLHVSLPCRAETAS